MNTQEYNQILRLHLLDMARVTQRGVDYAIKAYKLGNLEFCAIVRDDTYEIVRDDTYEIDELHREITGLVRDLVAMELSGESDLRYALASERIANALRVIHSQAVEIAADSTRILENGGGLGCGELATMADLVNSLMRLNVVALIEENVEHAQLAQRCSGVGRLFESTFYDWYRTIDHGTRALAEFERAIAKHFRAIALQAYEISEALVFRLEDYGGGSATDADKQMLAFLETTLADHNQEAVTISDGMQTFLENIDTCFADASFWN
jgi:phosphate uptake regulator